MTRARPSDDPTLSLTPFLLPLGSSPSTTTHPSAYFPRVVAAIQEQVTKGIHLQQNCMISQPMVRLLEKLDEVTPDGIHRFFFNGAFSFPEREWLSLA